MAYVNGDTVHIVQRHVDTSRPLKVIIIGAGISGIVSTIKLLSTIEDLDLTVYDKNEGLGGTWYENRYPGCACGKFTSFISLLKLMGSFRYSCACLPTLLGP